MERDNGEGQLGWLWPTRNVFWNLAICMIGFSLVVCGLFPFVTTALGVTTDRALSITFIAACVFSGFMAGLADYLLVAHAVRQRLGVLTARLSGARLSGAEREIAGRAGGDGWEALAGRYVVPVDSEDEFGRTNASFNYLVSALDASHVAERALRQSLVDQAKLAALGTLTAGVAHEMKNPLNFVVNFTELNVELCAELRGEVSVGGGEVVDDVEGNLNLVLHHAHRALAVMATMLEVGRSRAGDDARPCRLNQIVEQSTALADHSWRINRRDARCGIELDLDAGDPVVWGFEGDLVQVVINLVMNGLESAASVGGRGGQVWVGVRHDEGSAFVEVADNGPGIDAGNLTRVFEPFFTTKHDSGGTGLGLSISKDIVDNRHHGALTVTSSPGRGARFCMQLPLHSTASTATVAALAD